MLSKELIVQAIINSYAIDGFVVVTDNTGAKTNEPTDKFTDGKATITSSSRQVRAVTKYVSSKY